MEQGYLRALEKRLEWLRWAKEHGNELWEDFERHRDSIRKSHKRWPDALPAYESSLSKGDTFYMTKEFGHLVEYARKTVPDDLVFDHSWMQSKQGWLWLEIPFEVPLPSSTAPEDRETLGHRAVVRAIGWSEIPMGMNVERTNGRPVPEGSYYFLMFQDLAPYDTPGFGCWSYFSLCDGDKLIDRVRQFEDAQRNTDGFYGEGRTNDMMHEIRWVYSAFHLMSQKLAGSTSYQAPRPTRRRMEREQSPVSPVVRMVTLRRLQQEREKNPLERLTSPNSVDWQWQWVVRGHGRWQWFPSVEEHRFIWIDSYVKGPEDKPMKPPSSTIFVARR